MTALPIFGASEIVEPQAPLDRWSLPAKAFSPESSQASAAADLSSNSTFKAFLVVVETVAAMMLGAAVVSALVLKGPLVTMGFCVAFPMMLFIGLPLILAVIADAKDTD